MLGPRRALLDQMFLSSVTMFAVAAARAASGITG
jgi:hypothetical protein